MTDQAFSVAAWRAQDRHARLNVVQPQQISCWSRQSIKDGGEIIYGSTSGLGVYQQPQLPADLNEGYPDSYVEKPKEWPCSVEQVITAVQHADSESGLESSYLDLAQVVTFRNNLNKIFGTLVAAKDPWIIDACMHNGVMYLDIVKTDQPEWDNQRLMTYYGYKFETICTASQSTDTNMPATVDSTSEFATLVKLNLQGIRIILAAEVDLTDAQMPLSSASTNSQHPPLPPLQSYLELKTYKRPTHAGGWRTLFNFKWSKWWVQSFLAGVPTLILGQRDEQGYVTQVERLDVHTLPARAQKQGATWDAWQLLRFGTDVLRWMLECCANHTDQHLRFSYEPDTQSGKRNNEQLGTIKFSVVEPGDLPGRLQAFLD